jgi:hypothetical protein
MHDMGATSWGLLSVHHARRSPFLFRGGVNLPPPHPISKVLVCYTLYPLSDPSPANRNSDLAVSYYIDRLAQTCLAHLLQLVLHAFRRPFPTVCVRRPQIIGYCFLLPHQRLHPLDERQNQPQIPHYQLAHLSRQISMDDLDIAFDLITFVVSGHKHYYPIFDEQIAMATLNGITVPDAQYFRATCRLASYHVHQY